MGHTFIYCLQMSVHPASTEIHRVEITRSLTPRVQLFLYLPINSLPHLKLFSGLYAVHLYGQLTICFIVQELRSRQSHVLFSVLESKLQINHQKCIIYMNAKEIGNVISVCLISPMKLEEKLNLSPAPCDLYNMSGYINW